MKVFAESLSAFSPKIKWRPNKKKEKKKGLHRNLRCFFAGNYVKTKKKGLRRNLKCFFLLNHNVREIWCYIWPDFAGLTSDHPALRSPWGTLKSRWGGRSISMGGRSISMGGRIPPSPRTPYNLSTGYNDKNVAVFAYVLFRNFSYSSKIK